jgi:G3E family GTPase
MVKKKLPANIYRCKGIIYAEENREHRWTLQVVGRRADLSIFDEWGQKKPRTQFAAIGAVGSIDPEELRSLFDACISSAVPKVNGLAQ